MEYDALDRITGKTYPDNPEMDDVTYTYDEGTNGKGKRTGMSDSSGSTSYSYDSRGRLAEESRTIDIVVYATAYTYDGLDRVKTITYPSDEVVTQEYNDRGLPESLSGTGSGDIVTGTLYNNLGFLTDINLGNGVKTEYGYFTETDEQNGEFYGRLSQIRTYTYGGVGGTVDVEVNSSGNDADYWATPETFGYTDDDVIAGHENSSGDMSAFLAFENVTFSGNITPAYIHTYCSWVAGSPLLKIRAVDAENPSMPTSAAQAQAALANLTSAGVDWDSGLSAGNWVDSPDISTVLQELAGSYDMSGRRVIIVITNDGATGNSYASFKNYDEEPSMPAELYAEYSPVESNLDYLRYTWDPDGNLASRYDLLADETENFTYDFLNRLTGVSTAYSASFSYNTTGNMASMNGVSYTYGQNGAGPHAVTTIGQTSYAYDASGNMTTRGSQTLTWDAENRPVSISEGQNTTTFTYDGYGNRVIKTGNSETTIYINRYYEINLTTEEETSYYYLGGRLVAMNKDSALGFIHQDHQ